MAKLYVVPTPVGNLEDMTFRAISVLREVDCILAEDTRTSGILLKHFDIHTRMQSHHKFNEHQTIEGIVSRIEGGENIALISDAGTPAISDPGEDLVKQCAEAGIIVCAIPGPCAAITALSISGQSTGRFCFEGFLSTAKKSRREHLDALRTETRTMIFYEAPHKLVSTLADMSEVFGADRPVSLCRELTKLHEEVVRTTLGEALTKYTETPPKGEFVLIVAGAPETAKESASEDDAAARVAQLISQGLSRKDAVKQTAAELGLPKNVVYDIALKDPE